MKSSILFKFGLGCLLTAMVVTAHAGPRFRVADLALTVLAPATVNVSDVLNVQLVTYNQGPSHAKSTRVSFAVPATVTVTALSPECALAGVNIHCDLGRLRNNRQHTVSIQLVAPASGRSVLLEASVSSNTSDPEGSNNSAQATVAVIAPPPGPGVTVIITPPMQLDFTACWTDVYDNLPASLDDCLAPPEPGSMTLNADFSINTGDPGTLGTWSQPTPDTILMEFTDTNFNDLSAWRGTGVSASCYEGDIEFISAVAEAAWTGCVTP